MTRRGVAADAVMLLTAVLVFAVVSLPQLDLPGLYYDEAVDAVPAMQLVERQPVTLVRGAGLHVRSRDLPLMAMDYVGAVHTYAALPFFALFGAGSVPLRLMTVAGGALTVALTWLLGRAMFGRAVGLLAALLLAVHPSFVFYVRQGVHVSSLLAVFTVGSLLALWLWRRSGSTPAILLGSFLLGLGLWTKILFAWHIFAIVGLGVVELTVRLFSIFRHTPKLLAFPGLLLATASIGTPAGPLPPPSPTLPPLVGGREQAPLSPLVGERGQGREGERVWGVRPLLQAQLALLALIAGAWPFILFNLQTGGTFEVILKNSGRTQGGVDNAAWLANMGTRIEMLRVLLNGEHFWFLGGLFSVEWYPTLVGLLIAMLPALVWLQRRRFSNAAKPAAALALLLLLVLFQSAFTVSGLWPTHLFAFMPFLFLLAALATVLLARLPFGRPLPQTAAAALVLALLGGSLWTTWQYHRALAETGGRRAHSDAVYRLSEFLDRAPSPGPVMAMDWGISASVQLLTSGRVNPQESFFYEADPPPLFTDWMYGAMTGPGPRYFVFHAYDMTYFPRFDQFSALAKRWEKELVLVETVRERDTTPIYLVYSVR